MGNGMCERFNRTLLNMLGTLEQHQKANWKDYVLPIVHAYNCTRHESTGVSPYFLMFGRNPRLPIDLAFGLHKDQRLPATQYVKDLRERLARAYELAADASKQSQANQKEYYDLRCRGASIQKGDRVLVKIVAHEGTHKLADTWEDSPYIVLDQTNDSIPVYTVIREDGQGRPKKIHRNLLLPIGFLRDNTTPLQPRPTPRPRTRLQPATKHQTPSDESTDEDESSEESDAGYMLEEETVYSGPILTGKPTVYVPAPDVSIPSGDALPEDNQGLELETTTTRSASDMADATAEPQENTPEVTVVDQEPEVRPPPPPVAPRRSGRDRRPPGWMTSGKYDMVIAGTPTQSIPDTSTKTTQSSTEWQRKDEYLTSLAGSPLFLGLQKEAALAILDVISHH